MVADWNPGEARLTVYQGTQAPHMMQNIIAKHLGLAEAQVRMICKDVGGSFGIKVHVYADEMATAALSKLLRRPVKFVADRIESFVTDIHARDHRVRGRIGVMKDGRITAFEIDDLTGIGPYSMYPRTSAIEANQIVNLVGGPYTCRRYRARARSSSRTRTSCASTGPSAIRSPARSPKGSSISRPARSAWIRSRSGAATSSPTTPIRPTSADGAQVRGAVASRLARQAPRHDGLRRRCAPSRRSLREQGHSSRHRHRQLHRGHQPERGLLRRRRRAHLLAGRRDGAARRHRRGHLPDRASPSRARAPRR